MALAILLAAVASVAYLEDALAGSFDLTLVYFSIVLAAALVLPAPVAIGMAIAVAVVNVRDAGSGGLPLLVNTAARMVLYGYTALLTSRWEAERRKLMKMSRVDELTGLYNLRALREQLPIWLGPAVRSGRPMAVLMLDVDGFKAVNDRLGHSAGNELLREVANVLRMSVRVGDSLFRFGGDEFVLLLSDTDGAGAEVVAHRIQQAYHDLHQTPPASGVSTSFSVGIAVYPRDGNSADGLLAQADEALYRAKRSGKGEIVQYQVSRAA